MSATDAQIRREVGLQLATEGARRALAAIAPGGEVANQSMAYQAGYLESALRRLLEAVDAERAE